MGKLDGKVAIITGGAQGTGAAIARKFVAEGGQVVIGDIQTAPGKALAEELGPQACYVDLDVRDEQSWLNVISHTEREFGAVDILVNNAAVLKMAPLEETSFADYQQVIAVNQCGPFLGIKSVVASMKARGGGSIVNVGSTDGVFPGDQGLIAYGASKWALRGMTKIAAVELGRHGIRVNCVNPDAGNPMIGRPFFSQEEVSDEQLLELGHRMAYRILRRHSTDKSRIDEIVPMVLLLASDDGSACTGGDYPVDGGYSAGMCGLASLLGLDS